jgi:hypothetical protein
MGGLWGKRGRVNVLLVRAVYRWDLVGWKVGVVVGVRQRRFGIGVVCGICVGLLGGVRAGRWCV